MTRIGAIFWMVFRLFCLRPKLAVMLGLSFMIMNIVF